MKISDLIKELEQLPEDASIGTASFDENDCFHGRSGVMVSTKEELHEEIKMGNKNLDYYIES